MRLFIIGLLALAVYGCGGSIAKAPLIPGDERGGEIDNLPQLPMPPSPPMPPMWPVRPSK